MTWTQLTDKTAMPKLTWLMRALKAHKIETRLNGEGFERPVLEVREQSFNDAWTILGPIDPLPDNDPMFSGESEAWWVNWSSNVAVGNFVSAVGLLANQIRRQIAAQSCCVPEGASEFDCPLATGVIESCPAAMWTVCGPMVRLENFGIALSERMTIEDGEVMTTVDKIVAAIGHKVGAENVIVVIHAMAILMTRDALGLCADLVATEGDCAAAVFVDRCVDECAVIERDGKKVLVPKKTDIDMGDVIKHGFDPELN